MRNGKLQVGIIGCGGIANQKHMPSLARFPELCEMVAFCDASPERANQAVGDFGAFGAKAYSDYRQLLADTAIDVVHILTPSAEVSLGITLEAFAAGKHVMREKPLAHTPEDVQTMIDASRRAKKKFTVGCQSRFYGPVQTLYRACRDGFLGDIYFAKAHAVRRRAVPTWGVFTNKTLQGGGPLIDIGTHALDLALWLTDNYRPVSVSGSAFYKLGDKTEGNMFGPWDTETFELEDSAFGFIKMENGAAIYLESSWALNTTDIREASATLCGTEAGAELIGKNGVLETVEFNFSKYGSLMNMAPPAAGGIAYFEGKAADPGTLEAESWLRTILEDGEPVVKPEQIKVVTAILQAIYRSSETGCEVRLDSDMASDVLRTAAG